MTGPPSVNLAELRHNTALQPRVNPLRGSPATEQGRWESHG